MAFIKVSKTLLLNSSSIEAIKHGKDGGLTVFTANRQYQVDMEFASQLLENDVRITSSTRMTKQFFGG
jgi:hypothetical protein